MSAGIEGHNCSRRIAGEEGYDSIVADGIVDVGSGNGYGSAAAAAAAPAADAADVAVAHSVVVVVVAGVVDDAVVVADAAAVAAAGMEEESWDEGLDRRYFSRRTWRRSTGSKGRTESCSPCDLDVSHHCFPYVIPEL